MFRHFQIKKKYSLIFYENLPFFMKIIMHTRSRKTAVLWIIQAYNYIYCFTFITKLVVFRSFMQYSTSFLQSCLPSIHFALLTFIPSCISHSLPSIFHSVPSILSAFHPSILHSFPSISCPPFIKFWIVSLSSFPSFLKLWPHFVPSCPFLSCFSALCFPFFLHPLSSFLPS